MEVDGSVSEEAKPNAAFRHTRARRWAEGAVILLAIAVAVLAIRADAFWFERHAYGFRCARDPRLFQVAGAARAGAFAVAAILALVVRPLIGRAVSAWGLPSAGTLARCAAAVVVSLVTTEIILRLRDEPAPPADMRFCPPVRPSAVYQYGLLASSDYVWRVANRDIHYAVNAEGNRARTPNTEADHEKPTLLVAGESIALAMAIPYEESFAARLEEDLGVQVVDLGVHGYATDQAYLRTAEVLPLYARPIAIVTVFVPEQVIRAESETRSRLRIGADGALALEPPPPAWWRDLKLRALLRDAIPYHGDAEMADLRAIVRATADLARSRGAFPLFLATNFDVPCLDVRGKRPWLLRTLFDEQGIAYAAVDLPVSARVGGAEWHPGPIGHKMLADAVEAALRAKKIF